MAENGDSRVRVEIDEMPRDVYVQLHSTTTTSTEGKEKRCQTQKIRETSEMCQVDEICVAPCGKQEQRLQQQQQAQSHYSVTTTDIQHVDRKGQGQLRLGDMYILPTLGILRFTKIEKAYFSITNAKPEPSGHFNENHSETDETPAR
ncbi:hypothetical protein KPH14_010637 [Odynerus spinipes]|uniref:Uncharacterized protein n=1 Tax=Odynerus spinipes TaxID=1348599 RepID=A0AAD9RVE5_9HYME|nr:hypothetical protein KPH14_010637 [Odynerus spinipes]